MKKLDMRKVTIIGAGNVGATIAYTLAVQAVANEIVLIDINKEKAIGEAMDISQGTPFCAGAKITAGDYPDAVDSDIVIITSGMARKPGQTRLDLAQTNVNIIKDIAGKITPHAPNAIYILVSNPVDILTYVFHKVTGIPEGRIIGSGTILDTVRLRAKLARHFNISQQNIHAYVFGEHGDSSFVPWSQASIACVNIDKYHQNYKNAADPIPPVDYDECERFVHTSGGDIIARKGATFYAVAIATTHICKCIFSDNDTALTVSSMMHGEYGIDDLCLSTISLVGREGIKAHVYAELTEEETAKLQKSAECLRAVLKDIKI